jgi:hypothetical protein
MKIIPAKGTKCSKKGRGSCSDIRLRVDNLVKGFEEYEKLIKSINDKFAPLP